MVACCVAKLAMQTLRASATVYVPSRHDIKAVSQTAVRMLGALSLRPRCSQPRGVSCCPENSDTLIAQDFLYALTQAFESAGPN